jgi:hypothetical protein
MSKFHANLPDLVIANGATTTTTPITANLDDAEAIMITGPAALTGTVTVNVSSDGGTTYGDAGSGGSDITVGAGNTVTISPVPFNALKVTSGSAEGAARTFKVAKIFKVGG